MKIFCIGRNYAAHAEELNNPIPSEPVIFMKPPTALLKDNQPFYIPSFTDEVHFELEVVIKISKKGKHIEPQFASRYFDMVSLGIDFTARDIQQKCKEKGLPWEKAKAFDHSAPIGSFTPLTEEMKKNGIKFSLHQNGVVKQEGDTNLMLFSFEDIICQVSKYFTLQQGDLIYTGTPAGVGPVSIGDRLEGFLFDNKILDISIK